MFEALQGRMSGVMSPPTSRGVLQSCAAADGFAFVDQLPRSHLHGIEAGLLL